MCKKFVTLIVLIILSLPLVAQKYFIRDFSAEVQDSLITVHFQLFAKNPVDLGMSCSKDSMRTWVFCKTISGDIERQTFGNKTIVWNFLKDDFILEDSLLNNLLFRVREVEPYAIQREIEEKKLAKQKAKEQRALAKQKRLEECKLANENLNGHYIGLGNSLMTSGYYGSVIGLSYEYRYDIFGPNISVGYGKKDMWGNFGALNANIGLKLYLSHEKRGVRNFYFNVLPFCYFGQYEVHTIKYKVGNNQNIIRIDDYKYLHLWGAGVFFGYSPVWHVNKKIALGFNVDIGTKVNYKFNKWCPINWDLGFVIKF